MGRADTEATFGMLMELSKGSEGWKVMLGVGGQEDWRTLGESRPKEDWKNGKPVVLSSLGSRKGHAGALIVNLCGVASRAVESVEYGVDFADVSRIVPVNPSTGAFTVILTLNSAESERYRQLTAFPRSGGGPILRIWRASGEPRDVPALNP